MFKTISLLLIAIFFVILLPGCGREAAITPTNLAPPSTNTALPAQATPTETSLPPMATATRTATSIPPTPILTPLGGSLGGKLFIKSSEIILGLTSHELFLQSSDTERSIPLIEGKLKGMWVQSISPDGTKVLLSVNDIPFRWQNGDYSSTYKGNLFTLSVEDGLLFNLTDTDGVDSHSDWSPGGNSIAFTAGNNIMRVNLDGSGLTKLTRDGISVVPKWSPDGQSIAFLHRYSYDKSHIYLMAADGSGVKQLTSGEVADGWMDNMAWSPDGQYLAFSRAVFDPRYNSPVSGALYLLHIQTGELKQIANTLSKLPVWSPDGSKLAFSTGDYCVPCENSLMVFDITGKNMTGLMSYQDRAFDKIGWSPDGRLIQYSAWQWEVGQQTKYSSHIVDVSSGAFLDIWDEYWFFYWLPQPINHKTTIADCPTGSSKLTAGTQAVLAADRPTYPLRAFPGRKSYQITEVKQGMVLQLITRACAPERIYWLVTLPDGTQGWTAEGDGNASWLIPYTGQALPLTPTVESGSVHDCATGWTWLEIGDEAIVAPGDPNRVRSEPKKGDNMISKLPQGSVVKVLEGPVCADGLVFWKVESESISGGSGWTAEGDGIEHWLVPYP